MTRVICNVAKPAADSQGCHRQDEAAADDMMKRSQKSSGLACNKESVGTFHTNNGMNEA